MASHSGSRLSAVDARPAAALDPTSQMAGGSPGALGGLPPAPSDADRRRTILGIVTYVVLTLALSTIFYREIIRAGSLSQHGGLLVIGLMWCPGVAGLVTRLLFQRTLRGVGWRLGQPTYLWAGYWLPVAYASVIYLPLWATGYLDPRAPLLDGASSMLHLTGAPRPLVFLGYVLYASTLGLVANAGAALGEELGWRGFLVPELAKVTSFSRLAPLSGAIWAAWHVPLIVGADYHGAGPAWFSIGCFALGVIALGYIFAWLRLRSGSIWPVVLLHATHNLYIQAIFGPMTRRAPVTDYWTGEFGLGFPIVAGIVAYLLWRRRNELPNAADR